MKKILAVSMLFAFVLAGCNTFKGVGKDVSKAGDAVTNSAEKVENKLLVSTSFYNISLISIDKAFLMPI